MELLHSTTFPSKQKLLFAVTIATALFTIIPLLYPFLEDPNFFLKQQPSSQTSIIKLQNGVTTTTTTTTQERSCDLFSGEWVPNPEAPYYINTTCWAIHEHQNCLKFGRPDSDFMKWKWKPHGCGEDGLPVFDPLRFLETVRGKSMAFVGDSVSRNHMQSLICLLSQVEYPVDASVTTNDYFKRWTYETYNFTIAMLWTPYLVKSIEPGNPEQSNAFDLYLDEAHESWRDEIGDFDYIIISSGHWHYRPSVYYENQTIIGCHYCQLPNITDLSMFYGYRKAFRTAFKAILDSESFNGVMYLRTFAPSHFEGGLWNEGGNCLRKRPYMSNETQTPDETAMKLHKIQLEEFRRAEEEAKKKRKKLRLIDTFQAMWLRPDGHPSRYGHTPEANVSLYNDCVHWCLPGPIDNLNDFLLAMLKREEEKGLFAQVRKMLS